MCGICGAFWIGEGHGPEPVLPAAVLDRMTDAMVHRGPDDRGVYLSAGAALGVRRLSIVDVAGGHQPVASEDGSVWAVQNGELYNHAELRRELAGMGHRFRTRCDTEVLPHLFERFGTGFPERLRGKFAVAVWDDRQRRGVLARDRLGVKPLYYAESGGLLLFASEMKGLLASGLVPDALDYGAIDAYLSFGFFAGPRTPLAAVSKLLPGERLVVADGRVSCERYWRYPRPQRVVPGRSRQEYGEELLALLEESVRLRLMSDVPLGAMLSGGLDSSLVVALMARNMAEPVKTFSVGFVESGPDNELAEARHVAGLFGTDHHELELSFADQTVDLPELVWHLDEPLNDLSALGFLALSELAGRHVTVALSGQGADELLGGYPRHRTASLIAMLRGAPRPVTALGLRLAAHGPSGTRRAARVLAAPDAVSRLLVQQRALEGPLRHALLRGPLAALDGEAARRVVAARLNGVRDDDPIQSTLYADASLGLVDDMLHYFDRASMAHSLEVRVPFLDHHLVEFCARIPSDLKVRRLTTKHLLRHAARELLPDRIVDRPKVGFFNTAIEGWFRDQMRGAGADYLLDPAARYTGLLDRTAVERLVRAHSGGDGRHGELLLSILMLEVWLATYLPRATSVAAQEEKAIAVSL